MPKILVEPTWCFVDPTPDEAEALDQGMAIAVPGARFSLAYQKRYWDGKRHFFDRRLGRFPTGLLPFAIKLLKEARANGGLIRPIKFLDKRIPMQMFLKPHFPDGIPPCRDYQRTGVQRLLTRQLGAMAFRQGIVQCPTGSGKTRMGLEIAVRVPGRVLLVTHRLGIEDQWLQLFTKAEVEPDIQQWVIGPDEDDEDEDESDRDDGRFPWATRFDQGRVSVHPTSRFGFGMIQTMTKLHTRKHPAFLHWIAGVRTLIVDEGHRVNDKQFFPVLQAIPATVRVAFTATPLRRGDVGDVSLLGAFGPIVYKLKPKTLIKRNLLAKPTIIWEQIGKTPDDTPYADAYRSYIVEHGGRNVRIAQKAIVAATQGIPILILVRMIRHGRNIRQAIHRIDPNLRVAYISGSMPMWRRRRLLRSFRAGKFPILIGSTVLGEGIDIPEVGEMIMAGGGKGEIAALQQVGRGMRPKPDGSGVPIHEFNDLTNLYLAEHAEARKAAYDSMGYAQTGDIP